MQKQTIEFAVKRDNGNITRIDRTSILQQKLVLKAVPSGSTGINRKRRASNYLTTAGGWFFLQSSILCTSLFQ